MVLSNECIDVSFSLPAEFSNHYGTIVMVPFRDDIWRDKARYAQTVIFQIVDILSKHEHVFLCVSDKVNLSTIPKVNQNVRVVRINYDDIWARDISPFFITSKEEIRGLCFGFNAWGGREEGSYFPWNSDAVFSEEFAKYLDIDYYCFKDIVLEGGAIAHNGAGVLVTTESVLLNKNRNPFMSKDKFDDMFKRYFGIGKVIWLKKGFCFDETDGHIDVFLNFVDEHNVLLAWTDDINHPQYNVLSEALCLIENEKALDGNNFIVHKLYMPEEAKITSEESSGIRQHEDAIQRNANNLLFPTYNNAYVFNDGILVPIFNSVFDQQAIDLYGDLFNGRRIYPIYSKEILIGGGNFHCILHEIPAKKEK